MFNGLTPAITVALVAAFASLAVALIGGGIAVFNTLRTNDNQLDVEAFKADISRDLEHVKAELTTDKLTQWNTEFTAYQALWTAMARVRIA